MHKKFPEVKDKDLKFLFLDACFDEEDENEDKKFQDAMEDIYKMVESHQMGLETIKVNEKVHMPLCISRCVL